MDREELVVPVDVEQVVVGLEELGPDPLGQQAAEQEEEERGPDVEDPDALVVGGGEPADQGPAPGRRRGRLFLASDLGYCHLPVFFPELI